MSGPGFATPRTHPAPPRHGPAHTLARPELGVSLQLGLGGKGHADTALGSTSDDMDPSVGAAVHLLFPVHRHILVGGLFSVLSWNTDRADNAGIDRSVALSFDGMVRGQYPFRPRWQAYISLPVGFTYNILNDDLAAALSGTGVNLDNGVGWNIAVLFDAEYTIAHRVAGFVEIGWRHLASSHDVQGFGSNIDLSANQFALNFGAAFAL